MQKHWELKSKLFVSVFFVVSNFFLRVHVMSGKLTGAANEENDSVYKRNIEYAARILEAEDLLCVIEPINKYSVPNYYLNCYDRGGVCVIAGLM